MGAALAAGELLTLEQEGFLPNGLGRPGIAPGGPVKGTPLGRAAVAGVLRLPRWGGVRMA